MQNETTDERKGLQRLIKEGGGFLYLDRFGQQWTVSFDKLVAELREALKQ